MTTAVHGTTFDPRDPYDRATSWCAVHRASTNEIERRRAERDAASSPTPEG